MGKIEIEIPKNLEIWDLLDEKTKEKAALFAYIDGVSIAEYLRHSLVESVKSDQDLYQYRRDSAEIVEEGTPKAT